MRVKVIWSSLKYMDDKVPNGELYKGFFYLDLPTEIEPDELGFDWEVEEEE